MKDDTYTNTLRWISVIAMIGALVAFLSALFRSWQ